MKIVYKLAKNTAELDRQIELACESAHTLRSRVQIAAVSILRHAWEHNDFTRATILVDGLGNGVNQAALVAWFQKYGGFGIVEGKFKGWKGNEYIEENFQEAKNTMWFSFKAQQPFKGLSLEDEFQALLTRVNNAKKKQAKLDKDDPNRAAFDFEHVNAGTISAVARLLNFEVLADGEELVVEGVQPVEQEVAAA